MNIWWSICTKVLNFSMVIYRNLLDNSLDFAISLGFFWIRYEFPPTAVEPLKFFKNPQEPHWAREKNRNKHREETRRTLAVASVGSQRVAVRANAAEGSGYVVAAEGALVAHLLTLVDVFAHLHWSRSETVGTFALESALDVRTCSVATNVIDGALVVV